MMSSVSLFAQKIVTYHRVFGVPSVGVGDNLFAVCADGVWTHFAEQSKHRACSRASLQEHDERSVGVLVLSREVPEEHVRTVSSVYREVAGEAGVVANSNDFRKLARSIWRLKEVRKDQWLRGGARIWCRTGGVLKESSWKRVANSQHGC